MTDREFRLDLDSVRVEIPDYFTVYESGVDENHDESEKEGRSFHVYT